MLQTREAILNNFIEDAEKVGLGNLPLTSFFDTKGKVQKMFSSSSGALLDNETTQDEWKPFDFGDGIVLIPYNYLSEYKQAISEWLNGTDKYSRIIYDESQNIKKPTAPPNGSLVGFAARQIFEETALPTSVKENKTQHVYVSATFAEGIDDIEYLYGLGQWTPDSWSEWQTRLTGGRIAAGRSGSGRARVTKNDPFADTSVALMEQFGREFKRRGQFIARQPSMQGVELDAFELKMPDKYMPIADTPDGRDIITMKRWDRIVDFLQYVQTQLEEYGASKFKPMAQVLGYMRQLRGEVAIDGIMEYIQRRIVEAEKDRGKG